MMAGHMTDKQRRELEAALAAALLLIYRGKAQAAMTRLAAQEATIALSLNVREKVNAFAADRAQKVQAGINQRLDSAAASVPDDAPPAAQQRATARARSEIDTYNQTVLSPFLASWASHQAQSDIYSATTTADGLNARDATQWVWTQNTAFEDDCTEAAAASPASYDALVGITGSEPPVHLNCQCSLDPADASEGTSPQDQPAISESADEEVALEITPDVQAATDDALARAAAQEPTVTADLQEIAPSHAGTLDGLEYRLKGDESMSRKIATDALEKPDLTPAEIGRGMKDALRYTMLHGEEGFTDAVRSTLADFEARGYTVAEKDIKNTWITDAVYKGINVNMRTPDGYMFELQFHTPESIRVKMTQIHELYEEFRLPTTGLERKRELYDEMVHLSSAVPDPVGVSTIGRIISPVRP